MTDLNLMHLNAARKRLSELCDELVKLKWWNIFGFYSVMVRIKFINKIIRHFEEAVDQ